MVLELSSQGVLVGEGEDRVYRPVDKNHGMLSDGSGWP